MEEQHYNDINLFNDPNIMKIKNKVDHLLKILN